MKIVIAGPRYWDPDTKEEYEDLLEVYFAVSESPFDRKITEVVSGKALGVDTLGEIWARIAGVPIASFKIPSDDWKRYGKRAGHLRNGDMADYADGAIILYDGYARGSANMIEQMKSRGKPYHVHSIDTATSIRERLKKEPKGTLDGFL